jgi:hypothetical protein
MTWSSFAITATYITAKEATEFAGQSDATVIATKKEQAKRDMLLDLFEAFGINDETDSDFETILDTYTDRLREALSCKQLYWYFLEKDMGQGTINNERYKHYDRLYKSQRQLFSSLRTDGSKVTRVKMIVR